MPRGRPLKELTLTAEERATLTRWTRRPTTAANGQRAVIVGGVCELDAEERVRLGTQLLAEKFEEVIRVAPEQWHLILPNWPSDHEAER